MSTVFALLDEVATLSKPLLATLDDVAAASAKAAKKSASVIIDDFAVTPKYLDGAAASREIPMIISIAKGSMLNKAILVPVALFLNYFIPILIIPLLCIGGLYLAFEGVEKVYEMVKGTHHKEESMDEAKTIKSAIKTDFILSAEIMIIALSVVADRSFTQQALSLVFVAVAVTLFVYFAVAAIVRLDDLGFYLAKKDKTKAIGIALAKSVPTVLKVLAVVGTLAMLSVGGGIVEHTLHHYHLDFVHHLYEVVEHAITFIPSGLVEFVMNIMLGFVAGTPFALLAHKLSH